MPEQTIKNFVDTANIRMKVGRSESDKKKFAKQANRIASGEAVKNQINAMLDRSKKEEAKRRKQISNRSK